MYHVQRYMSMKEWQNRDLNLKCLFLLHNLTLRQYIFTDEENEAKEGTSNLPKVIQRNSDTGQVSCV